MKLSRPLAIAGALGLGVVLPLVGATAASAHTPAFTVSCTALAVSLTNYPAGSTVSGTVDGVNLGSSTFGPEGFRQSLPLDPTVKHTWSVTVVGSDGQGNKTYAGSSDPSCIPAPPVEPPVVVPPVEPPVVVPPVEPPVVVPPVEPPVVVPPVEPPVVVPPAPVVAPLIQTYCSPAGLALVLDNTGSTLEVRYLVSGEIKREFVVAAGQAIHTDADGFLFAPGPDGYVVLAGDRTWTIPATADCGLTPVVPPVDEPTTPEEPTTPVEPETPVTPEVPAVETPAVVVPVAETTPAPKAPVVLKAAAEPTEDGSLAFTGSADNLPLWIAGTAAITGGISLLVGHAIGYRRAEELHSKPGYARTNQ
jgi:hypothetical protein